jgi:hypothetical protein
VSRWSAPSRHASLPQGRAGGRSHPTSHKSLFLIQHYRALYWVFRRRRSGPRLPRDSALPEARRNLLLVRRTSLTNGRGTLIAALPESASARARILRGVAPERPILSSSMNDLRPYFRLDASVQSVPAVLVLSRRSLALGRPACSWCKTVATATLSAAERRRIALRPARSLATPTQYPD